MIAFDYNMLERGDSLLYYGESSPYFHNAPPQAGIVDWVISTKTGYYLSHIEIYQGHNESVASRNGIGVNRYPLRLDGLVCVRRPMGRIDFKLADKWFKSSAKGQGYDFKGLLCFYLAVKQGSPNKMFCSEFATRWYRHAGIEPFNREVDADRVAPCEFWKTAAFSTVWQKNEP
jgi:hypothetical protein